MSAPDCSFLVDVRGTRALADARDALPTVGSNVRRPATRRRLDIATAGASAALLFALAGCSPSGGGSSGDSSGGGGTGGGSTVNMQSYTVRWIQGEQDAVDSYTLAIGEQSGNYGRSVSFQANQSSALSDGTFAITVQIDRNRNQYLLLRAFGEGSSSPPSNELMIPPLGAGAAMAAQAMTATASAMPSSVETATGSTADAISLALGFGSSSGSTDSPGADGEGESTNGAPDLGDRNVDGVARDADPANDAESADDSPLRSLALDGDRDFLASSAASAFAPNGSFTLTLWARPTPGDSIASASPDGSSRQSLVRMRCESGDCESELVLATNAMAGAEADPSAPSTPSAAALELWRVGVDGARVRTLEVPLDGAIDAWMHVALAFDASSDALRLHVDGTLLASSTSASLPEALVAGWPMRIAFGQSAALATAFAGHLGHAATFESALDEAALETLALGGHALDLRELTGTDAGSIPMPAHYWRLGASADEIGRDVGARPLALDDVEGGVDAAHIVADWPEDLR